MRSRGRVPRLPEPPWSYAPSEVAEWLASTSGGRKGPRSEAERGARVKGFTGRYPASLEARVVQRLARKRFAETKGARHLLDRSPVRVFRARVAGTKVEVRMRIRDVLEVRVDFRPPIAMRRAAKVVSNLGLPSSRGRWR